VLRRSFTAPRCLFVLAALALLIATVPQPAAAQGATIQALAVGDSITVGYGPAFVKKFEAKGLGKAGYAAYPATNPCSTPWAQWIRDYPKARLDYVVLEDFYQQGDPYEGACPSETAWRAAWQDLVNAAKEKSAYVIVLDGTHPDLSSVTGIDILDYPVPPPDFGDGVHYTDGGYKQYAANVVDLLAQLEGCTTLVCQITG
jgi:lysophospholipase L1-like esterase